MNERENFPFVYTHRVRFNEVDGQNIVFNANYLTFFDHAITEYFRTCGITFSPHHTTGQNSISMLTEEGKDFNVVKSVVEYKGPAEFDDILDIYVRIDKIGRSSVTWRLATYKRRDDTLVTLGEIVWVYSDQQARRSEPVPDDLRERLLHPNDPSNPV